MNRHELLSTSRDRYFAGFQQSVDRSLSRGLKGLGKKAGRSVLSSDQARYLAARGILQQRAADLRRGMHSCMDRLLTRSLQTTYSAFRPALAADIHCEDLVLVETAELENELRIVRITERLRNEAEAQVRDLNVRIALLFDQENIKERENPFRPYLISRSIAEGVEHASVSPELAPVLIAELAEQMEADVANIFASVNSHLAEHGVDAKLQKVIKLPTYPGGGGTRRGGSQTRELEAAMDLAAQRLAGRFIEMIEAAATGSNPQAATTDNADRGTEGTSADRHQVAGLLRGFFRPQQDPRSAAAGGANAALAATLDQMVRERTPRAVEMLGGAGEVRNLLLERRGELAASSEQPIEQMRIDVVAMLFGFILRDSQVPAEVRVQLGRLQFLVLKIALQDPALLSQSDHPVRMLINRIGSVAVRLKTDEPSGARIEGEIRRVIDALLQDASGQRAPFARMLAEFDSFIDGELRRGDERVERAIQAAESAQARAAKLAAESERMGHALAGLTLDPLLTELLALTWVGALERCEREDPGKAQLLRAAVPDLLWSIVAKTGQQDRAALLALLPGMLDTLRAGLELSDWDAERKRRFFEWLMSAHSMALRSRIDATPGPDLLAIRQHFESYTERAATPPAPAMAADPAAIGRFLEQEIDESDARIHLLDRLLDQPADAPPTGPSADGGFDGAGFEPEIDALDRLRNGIAIEIGVGGTPSIGVVNWLDQGAAHMVLTLDCHPEPAVISVRVFLRMLRNGRVRFLEPAPLFERAVEALLQSAERHDDGTL